MRCVGAPEGAAGAVATATGEAQEGAELRLQQHPAGCALLYPLRIRVGMYYGHMVLKESACAPSLMQCCYRRDHWACIRQATDALPLFDSAEVPRCLGVTERRTRNGASLACTNRLRES